MRFTLTSDQHVEVPRVSLRRDGRTVAFDASFTGRSDAGDHG